MEDRMPTGKNMGIANWLASIGSATNLFRQVTKLGTHLPEDPFLARKAIQLIAERLKTQRLDLLGPPAELLHELDSECVRQKAQFWDHVLSACTARDWQLHGTTSRRLLNR